MVFLMEMVRNIMLVEIIIKVSGLMEKNREKVNNIIFNWIQLIMVSGSIIWKMVRDTKLRQMGPGMRENLKMEWEMVKVRIMISTLMQSIVKYT